MYHFAHLQINNFFIERLGYTQINANPLFHLVKSPLCVLMPSLLFPFVFLYVMKDTFQVSVQLCSPSLDCYEFMSR